MEVESVKQLENIENTVASAAAGAIATTEASPDFKNFLMRALGGEGQSETNEEELFAAIIEQRLEAINPDAANHYRGQKAELMTSMARSDGYVSVEDVAKTALRSTMEAGLIDEATASQVQAHSFSAAQLDDNLNALYDSRGSGDDPTIATAAIDDALSRVQRALERIDSGEEEVPDLPLDESTESGDISGTQELDGEGGFLWKPESESDGNLVVLLPTELRGEIERVEIHSENPPTEESKLAEGRFAGDEHNGERLHYRFETPGAEYGSEIFLTAYKTNGDVINWFIANGAERQD